MIGNQIALRIAGSALHDMGAWSCFGKHVPAYQSQYPIASKIGGQIPAKPANFNLPQECAIAGGKP